MKRNSLDSRPGAWRRIARGWRGDARLSVLLGLLSLLTFVVGPLRSHGLVSNWAPTIAFAVVALAGVLVVTEQPGAAWTAGVFALMAIMLGVWHQQLPSVVGHVVRNVIMAMYLATLAWGIIHQVLRPGPVNRHHIMGAVVVYLLFGLIWSQFYDLVEKLAPGSFTSLGGSQSAEWSDFLYFSIVTLTTLGYGDITPLDATARSLAAAEAMIGQLFPTILIARLVAQALQRTDGDAGSP